MCNKVNKSENESRNNILHDAYGSPHTDWNYRNRHELIAFLHFSQQDFISIIE